MNGEGEKRRFNLVWTTKGLAETSWLRFLIAPVIGQEIVAENFEFLEPGSLYVVSANKNVRQSIPTEFVAALAGVPGKGLIHLSDEYYAGGYGVYREFDLVLRTYHAAWFDKVPEVLVLPLGWADGTPTCPAIKPAETRNYVWSFLGNQRASSRPEMLRALRQIVPHFVYATSPGPAGERRMSRPEYHAVLHETMFAPCPMGNAVLETWRFYEALEAGCIPIIETRPWMRYHERLLGPHPIPTVHGWSQSVPVIKALASDPVKLSTLQERVAGWWTQRKQLEQHRVARFICEGLGRQPNELSQRHLPSTSPLWPARRFIELLRHQSVMSSFRRLQRLISRRVFR